MVAAATVVVVEEDSSGRKEYSRPRVGAAAERGVAEEAFREGSGTRSSSNDSSVEIEDGRGPASTAGGTATERRVGGGPELAWPG